MKLKINKACDLNSISVLPPQSRRGNSISFGTDSLVYGKSQPSQLKSQSQHSFSQGMSLSQSSLDDIMTNDPRHGSQERDNSVKRISCLAPITYRREETEMPASRSSNNVIRRWNSASVSDYRCQLSEDLENKIGLVETSVNRLGMVIDSIQSDLMQVNKAVKEVSIEIEGIRQKMTGHDKSLQLMLKGEEDIKTSLDEGLKSISHQFVKESEKNKLEEIVSVLSVLPSQIETHLGKLENELCGALAKELAIMASMKPTIENHQSPSLEPQKRKSCRVTQPPNQQKLMIKNSIAPPKFSSKKCTPKAETDNPKSLKPHRHSFTNSKHNMEIKHEEATLKGQGQDWGVIIESDEEIDEDLSFLLEEKEIGITSYSVEDAKEDTKRILRRARRKRKFLNATVLV